MRRFLSDVLIASEKAAHIARTCRKEKDLFQLLIEEKSGGEKNSKFQHDFKTLADVLIQETVRHDLGKQYPNLAKNIFGEETNKFTNTLGETIQVRVLSSEQETSDLLNQVLDDHKVAADLLSKQVHSEAADLLPGEVEDDVKRVPEEEINLEDWGIWIDPIDSTNNYIRGSVHPDEYSILGDSEMTSKGLQVVTVLIGIFNRRTGEPVAGVINQPFAVYDKETMTWRGQVYWGVICKEHRFVSSSLTSPVVRDMGGKKKVIISFTEEAGLKGILAQEYELYAAAGAGYKFLCVARGFVDLYVTQKGSTYKWDSCAGHALLAALGGGCLDFKRAVEAGGGVGGPQLKYNTPRPNAEGIDRWSNDGGVLAFREGAEAERVLKMVAEGAAAGQKLQQAAL